MKHSFFVLLLIFVSATTCFAGKEDFIFYYDFNDEEAGEPPSEPWMPTAAGEILVEDFPDSENKSVKVEDQGSGGGMTLILDTAIEGTVSLEYMFLREESSGSEVEVFYVLSQECADNWSGVCVAMVPGKNGVLQYHDGAWVNTDKIEDGEWHTVKYVMYVDQKKWDLYYDEESVIKNADFRNYGSVEGIDKFNVANVGNGGTTFVMYFDDIVLYEGTVRPSLLVEPSGKLATTWAALRSVTSVE